MKTVSRTPLLALVCVSLLTHTLSAQDHVWPQFRGPNCSGIAAEGEKPPITFGPQRNVLWKTPLPLGHSSPCIWGDRIFVTGCDKSKKELYVVCVDRKTGSIRWEKTIAVERFYKAHGMNNAATATATTDGERVYAYFSSYEIACYDNEGNPVWSQSLPDPQSFNGSASSPILARDYVILNRDGNKNAHFLCLNKHNGDLIWKVDLPPPLESEGFLTSHSTPVVWKDQFITHRAGEIAVYDIESGERTCWYTSFSTGASTPVVVNDIIYVATWHSFGESHFRGKIPEFEAMTNKYDTDEDKLLSKTEIPDDLYLAVRPELMDVQDTKLSARHVFDYIDKNKDSQVNQVEWSDFTNEVVTAWYFDHGLIALDPEKNEKGSLPSSAVLWKEVNDVPEVPTPICLRDRIYMIKNGGIVSCMNAQTGELLFRDRLEAKGLYISSPVAANNMIYIASRNGIISVFEAGDTLNVLAKNDLEDKIMATPAIVDNKIYVRTAEHLYAFGE